MNIRKVSKDCVIRGILKNGIEEILYIERELSYQWRLQVILSFGSSDSGIIVVRVKPREQGFKTLIYIKVSSLKWKYHLKVYKTNK